VVVLHPSAAKLRHWTSQLNVCANIRQSRVLVYSTKQYCNKKKAVQSHRWPRDATTKLNKHPEGGGVALGWTWLNSIGRYGRRCWLL